MQFEPNWFTNLSNFYLSHFPITIIDGHDKQKSVELNEFNEFNQDKWIRIEIVAVFTP